MPILCVDAVILKDNKFLLVKRKIEPLKGYWWTPGGRVYKNEKLKNALHRKVKEEIGIKVKIISLLGFYEDFYKKNNLNIDSVHTVSAVFLCKHKYGIIKLDTQSSAFKWSSTLPKKLKIYDTSKQAVHWVSRRSSGTKSG